MSQPFPSPLVGTRFVPALSGTSPLSGSAARAAGRVLRGRMLALGAACLGSVLACSAGGATGESHITSDTAGSDTAANGDGPRISNAPPSGAPSASAPSAQPLFSDSELQRTPDDACSGKLPVVFRDFSQSHPDFEMAFSGDVVRRQLVSATLGADRTPSFASSTGCPWKQGTPTACDNWKPDKPVITSADSFAQWYHDVPNINQRFEKILELKEDPQRAGTYTYNSNSFFPLGNDEGFGVTPPGSGHNFLFTTELHLVFQYIGGQKFTFRGDDDLWIFVNGHLALDLGSMHAAAEGTIDFDAQAADLAILPNNAYTMDIFHAERHTSASNFGIETNIACFTSPVPR